MTHVFLLAMSVNLPFILVIIISSSKIFFMCLMLQKILFWFINSHMILTPYLNFICGIFL
jgi:hypothetical protein